jgi:hypothetical protein
MVRKVMKYGDGYPMDRTYEEWVPDNYQLLEDEYFIPEAGPSDGAKIAMFALVLALVVGAVFYWLNTPKIKYEVKCPEGYICTPIK